MDGIVNIPWGDWLALFVTAFGGVFAAIAAWALRFLPGWLKTALMLVRIERVIQDAVDQGVAKVAGAARGQKLTVEVGNEVLEAAAEYAVRTAGDVVEWLGESDLRDKILAKLDLEPDSTVETDEIGTVKRIIRGGK